jgi:hypothetical protein
MNHPPKKSNTLMLIVIILAVIGTLGVVMIAVVVGLGFFARERYLMESKKAEGKTMLGAIARGMVACMEPDELSATGEMNTPKELPPSSPAVPASAPKGMKYMSAPSDWASPAFTCARFSMSTPQYFQYQWEKVSATNGVVRARADLDGDGVVDVNLEVEVRCTATWSCTTGALVEK